MISIWNHRLLLTYDVAVQAKVREALSAGRVDYKVNPVMVCYRAAPAEYKIYVRKKDYERGRHLIREVLG